MSNDYITHSGQHSTDESYHKHQLTGHALTASLSKASSAVAGTGDRLLQICAKDAPPVFDQSVMAVPASHYSWP